MRESKGKSNKNIQYLNLGELYLNKKNENFDGPI